MGAGPARFPFFAESNKESRAKGHASHAKHRDNGRDEHFRLGSIPRYISESLQRLNTKDRKV
jgi:hypothetical protein